MVLPRSRLILALVLLCCYCMRLQAAPSDRDIRQLLAERIETGRQSIGMVVGLLNRNGAHIVSYGATRAPDGMAVDGDTIFEIGSISKVFTTTLLAAMVERGEVGLDDPVARYLPAGVVMPRHGSRDITLRDLATHRSGLPRLPANLPAGYPQDPTAEYSAAMLYDFLRTCRLTRDPGSAFEYSNLGIGLLGHVLALRAGTDYTTLVRLRVLEPLAMFDTAIVPTPRMHAHMAIGHNQDGVAVAPNADMSALAGALSYRSSANDLLLFLAANLGLTDTPLNKAMQAARALQNDGVRTGSHVGLGWLILDNDGNDIVWHNGATSGFRSYIGFLPQQDEAVVVLSNQSNWIDDLGHHLLNPRQPLSKVQAPRALQAIALPARAFDAYIGRYRLTTDFEIEISRDGTQFYARTKGLPRFEIFPENEQDFFTVAPSIQLSFARDARGRVSHLVLHQNGQDLSAEKTN